MTHKLDIWGVTVLISSALLIGGVGGGIGFAIGSAPVGELEKQNTALTAQVKELDSEVDLYLDRVEECEAVATVLRGAEAELRNGILNTLDSMAGMPFHFNQVKGDAAIANIEKANEYLALTEGFCE